MFDTFTQKFPRDYTAAYTLKIMKTPGVVDLLFIVPAIVCGFFCVCPPYVV